MGIKTAGIGTALRAAGSKLVGVAKRVGAPAVPKAPKIGLMNTVAKGATYGAAGGAIYGGVMRKPQQGQTRFQSAMRGARSGAMLGVGGGMVGRNVGNRFLQSRHTKQLAKMAAKKQVFLPKRKQSGVGNEGSSGSVDDQGYA